MKIAVLNNCVPFLRGGAEHLADALTGKLREYGHEAMLVRVPFRWDPPSSIIEHILATRSMRLPNFDLAIGFKFPVYYIPHPNKIVWLLHQFRQAYDFWGTEFQGLPDSPEGVAVRDAVRTADNHYLREARRIFTNSHVTGGRLQKFNGIASEVLLPPLLSTAAFSSAEYGDFVFAPGRVNATKRQHLLVRAMRHCKTGVKLIVGGRSETPEDAAAIQSTIREHHLQDRVQHFDRFLPEEEKVELLSRCLACAYIPYDEDSYGYVTLEGCLSRRPVITCTDSGGIDTLVRHQQTGYIAEPQPEALALAMDALYSDRAAARRMGEEGYEMAVALNINWDHVIRMLTS